MVEQVVGNAIGTGVHCGFGNSAAEAAAETIGRMGGGEDKKTDWGKNRGVNAAEDVKNAKDAKDDVAARFRGIARGNALTAKRYWERLT